MTKKLCKMKIAALILAVSFVASQSLMSANATTMTTTISNVTGTNGVYNISPESVNGTMGLRAYTDFTLAEGDIANLIFKYGSENVEQFVNLVTNQININGLVNTVRDGSFYNGEAIFVSPNGLVIGESGVLNVGSLSVLTPTESGMKMFKDGDATLEELGYHGNSNIEINGKVLARGNVGLVGRDITIGSAASIIAGGSGNETVISSEDEAETLFNALVNTGKSDNDASIEFRTYNRDGSATEGLEVNGSVINFGSGDIVLTNRGAGLSVGKEASIAAYDGDVYLVNGSSGLYVSGNVTAEDGSVYLTNGTNATNLYVRDTAELSAEDLVQIVNSGSGDTLVEGSITSNDNVYITAYNGALNINGTIKNANGKIAIAGNGTGLTIGEDAVISGEDGEIKIVNTGKNGLTFNGKITDTTSSVAITNRAGDFTVGEDAVIENSGADMNLTNTSGTFTFNGTASSSGDELLIQNTGDGGFELNGSVSGSGSVFVQNTNGALNVNGTVDGEGEDNSLYIGNTGDGGLTIAGEVTGNNNKVQIVNTGSGGLSVEGDVSGTGTGTVAITNRKGDMVVSGNVNTEEGDMTLTNAGSGSLSIATGAVVGSTDGGELTVQNTGSDGMDIDGTIENTGSTVIYNKAGDMNIAGDITNTNGKLSITNAGDALNIEETATVTNDENRLYITNKGDGGMNVQGTITGEGHVLLTNRAGGMDISSDVTSTDGNVVLTNSGDQDMTISGTVTGKKITVTGDGQDVVLGNVITDEAVLNASSKVVINVENADLLNVGSEGDLIKSDGDLYISVDNGTIGEEVVSDNAIGEDARDLTKSINVNIAGNIKAFTNDTKDTGDDLVINLASQGVDMNVNRIKADGTVMLLTTDGGSILNTATDLDNYANVKGTNIQIISSGSVGTADNPLHFRQTDSSQESNILAEDDIYIHQRGEADGEDVNFGIIKSRTGSIEADMIKDGTVNYAIAPGYITITARKNDADLTVTTESNDTTLIKDYFDDDDN